MEIDQTGLDAYSFCKKHKVPILDQKYHVYNVYGRNGHRKIETVQGKDSNGDKLSLIVGNHPGNWKGEHVEINVVDRRKKNFQKGEKKKGLTRNFLAAHRGITLRKHDKDYEYGVKE